MYHISYHLWWECTSTVRVFLSALKQFYHVACRLEWYAPPHPLTDPISSLTREVENEQRRLAGLRPRMPQWSGVEEPLPYSASDNYFKLVGDDWKLHPIDDPDLHVHLCKGFKLAHFSLRDQLVVRIAYESGARIHEILCLTVSDWRKRGAKQEALACNKGSHGRRVKTLRFSSTTARMLHAYVNTERIQFDPLPRRLEALDDSEVLFLSRRGKPYSYDGFKKHWYRLCQALKIDLNIHALRHWFVTQELRLICETAKEPGEIERGKEGLVRYMAWRNPDTLRVYEHYFDEQQHASIQDQLHAKWHEADVRYETASLQGSPELFLSPSPSPQQSLSVKEQIALTTSLELGWDELLSLGGATHG